MKRAEVIFQVQSGQITATEGAKRLGVSRKTYYQWEKKALRGWMEALENGEGGRPPKPEDPEKIHLHREVIQLRREKEALESRLVLKDIFYSQKLEEQKPPSTPTSKKKRGSKKA